MFLEFGHLFLYLIISPPLKKSVRLCLINLIFVKKKKKNFSIINYSTCKVKDHQSFEGRERSSWIQISFIHPIYHIMYNTQPKKKKKKSHCATRIQEQNPKNPSSQK